MALSNTAVPKYYGMFRDAVLRGEIPVNKEISMEMNRIDDLIANPGVYYDDQAVEGWIAYCEAELTLTDGSDLSLLDTFKLWGEQIFGWYYFVERSVYQPNPDGHGGHYVQKNVKKRLINKQYLIVARGAAKSMYASTLPKSTVAIVENPLYAVVNEPNSTMQRLIRKLNLLDVIDEQSGSGKLDLIIQLPYVIKTEARRQQAENRRKDIEAQLSGTKYGIAYADGTERITQLNRSVNNNLMSQIEYLTSMLYSQLGITQSILDGTADEKTMLNYNNRTIEPIISAIVDEMKRKFLTKTARSQSQSISFFRDPFKLVPVNDIAEIADKFTRNEIMTSNEIRQVIGMKPSDDPRADELRNKNLSAPNESEPEINPPVEDENVETE